MHRFYVNDASQLEKSIEISGEDVNHIKNVLRLKCGEQIIVGDGNGTDYICRISDIGASTVIADIEDVVKNAAELDTEITLYQGMPKSDKMELIIQKAVELGAARIVPVYTERTVVKLDAKKEAKKLERYNAIALSAAKQSGRGIVPRVDAFASFKNAINEAKELDMGIIPYEEAEGIEQSRKVVEEVRGKKNLAIFIGPEGGFAKSEVELAIANGIIPITLGRRILRTETAGLAVLSIISFAIDN